MGSRGLWRHIEGTTIVPKLYALINHVPVLSDGKMPATEEQIKVRETCIINYDKQEYLTQHIIILTILTHLGGKIKDLNSVKDMWDTVKVDAMTKSTLYLLDTEDQLVSMKLSKNNNPKAHLNELRQHFQLMLQCCDNLTKMGLTISDTCPNFIIMSSLLDSYRPTLQTITAVEHASATLGMSISKKTKPDDLITFLTEEAQHHIINDK